MCFFVKNINNMIYLKTNNNTLQYFNTSVQSYSLHLLRSMIKVYNMFCLSKKQPSFSNHAYKGKKNCHKTKYKIFINETMNIN